MAKMSTRKRLWYVRAVHPKSATRHRPLQALVAVALNTLQTTVETQIAMHGGDTWMVRHRRSLTDGLFLSIGGGEPGAQMSTLELFPHVAQENDSDQNVDAPERRAFKLHDAHCLIDGDNVIVCLEHARLPSLAHYLSAIIAKASNAKRTHAFELVPVTNKSKMEILDAEGIKEIRIRSVLYAATADGIGARGIWAGMRRGFGDVFTAAVPSDAKRDALAQELGDLNVEMAITPRRGTKAEPVVLEAMDAAGREIMDEIDGGDSRVTITTKLGSRIRASEITLAKFVPIDRVGNALSSSAVCDALIKYRSELITDGGWDS